MSEAEVEPAGALISMNTLVAIDGVSEIPEPKEATDVQKPYKEHGHFQEVFCLVPRIIVCTMSNSKGA